MPRFRVHLQKVETYALEVEVEADSEEQAIAKARQEDMENYGNWEQVDGEDLEDEDTAELISEEGGAESTSDLLYTPWKDGDGEGKGKEIWMKVLEEGEE